MDPFLLNELTRNINIALKEDQIYHDLTSQACFPQSKQAEAKLILKQDALLAGLILFPLICPLVNPTIQWKLQKEEGKKAKNGEIIATLKGPIHTLMAIERTTLNFIQHATSIATKTATYVKAVNGKCEILDTRKTLPTHRFLQKYAVALGGGTNHRLHLGDQILIKDNHLAYLKKTETNPIQKSIQRAQAKYPDKQIEIEVTNLNELREAIHAKPNRILLDNMSPEEVKQSAQLCPKDIYLEASGKMNLSNIRSYADTGVHGISIGELTHSIEAVDMSLKI